MLYTIVNTLSSLITLPLFAAVLTIIYFDLRVRKEGFDLQLLARGVGQRARATSPARASARSSRRSAAEPQGGGFAPPAPARRDSRRPQAPPACATAGAGSAPPQPG